MCPSSLLLSVWPLSGDHFCNFSLGQKSINSVNMSSGFTKHFHVQTLSRTSRMRLLGTIQSFLLHHLAWNPEESPHLLEATLDAAVFTGNHFAVPVLWGPAGETQVGVALSHSQIARTLLSVALGLTATARETILTWVGWQARLGREAD